jgi:hypothetical protein
MTRIVYLYIMNNARNATLAGARFQASVRLCRSELPECFGDATEASLNRAKQLTRLADKRDARRLAQKAAKIGTNR